MTPKASISTLEHQNSSEAFVKTQKKSKKALNINIQVCDDDKISTKFHTKPKERKKKERSDL